MKEGKKLALELSLDELNLIWSILHDLHSDPEVELKEEDDRMVSDLVLRIGDVIEGD